MRLLLLTTLCVLTLPVTAQAEDRIAPDVLTKLKAATVFIKAKIGSEQDYGTGFLIKGPGDRNFIVTHRFVVTASEPAWPGNNTGPTRKAKIDVVFDSGQSTERSCKADVVVEDKSLGLALLKLQETKDLPVPLEYARSIQFTETLPLCILGFPFGKELSKGNRNPAMTVSRGTVSSIRNDGDKGKIIQVDAELNPGQTGGPVMDMKGQVIGIAAIGIDGTKIGIALPSTQIADLFQPHVSKFTVACDQSKAGKIPIRCTVEAQDPPDQIRKVSLRYASAEGRSWTTSPPEKGTVPELPKSESIDLDLKGLTATGRADLLPVNAQSGYLFQIVVSYSDNSISRSVALPVSVKPSIAQAITAESREMWMRGFPCTLVVKATAAEVSPSASLKSPTLSGEFKLPGVDSPRPSPGTRDNRTCWCWAADGQALYHLDRDGIVRKFSCPDLKELASYQTDLKEKLSLSLSATGVVVSGMAEWVKGTPPKTSVLILDAASLKPTATINPTNGWFDRTVSAPSSSFAYGVFRAPNTQLAVIDVAKGEIVKQYNAGDLGFPEPAMDAVVISPNAKWLVGTDYHRLSRFRLDGAEVKLEETSPDILYSSRPELPVISADGKWVRATCKDMQWVTTPDGRSGYQAHFFAMESFEKPAHAIQGVSYESPVNFDRAHEYVYVWTDAYSIKGDYIGGHKLHDALDEGERVNQLLLHPDGSYFAFLTTYDQTQRRIILVKLAAPTKLSPNDFDSKRPKKKAK